MTAAAKGHHGGRPKVIDDDSLLFARALKDKGISVPEIAKKLTIKTGKNAGKSPSVASLHRALIEAEQQKNDGTRVIEQRRPVPARITGPGSGTDPELMERLTRQALGGANDDVMESCWPSGPPTKGTPRDPAAANPYEGAWRSRRRWPR